MKSTSSRIKNFWIPKPTSLLSAESPDTLEMDKFDKWFSIDISLPFFFRAANQRASSYLDHIQKPGYWKQLPSSMHSIILTSRKISLKTVIKTSSRLRHILLDLPTHKVSASKGLYRGNQLIQLCCTRWDYIFHF